MSQTPLQDPIHFPQSLVLKLHLFSTEAHFLSDFIPPTWLSMSFSCYLTGWTGEVLQRALHLPFLCSAGKKLTSRSPRLHLKTFFQLFLRLASGDFLLVQWLRRHAPNAGGLGLTSWSGN